MQFFLKDMKYLNKCSIKVGNLIDYLYFCIKYLYFLNNARK